MYYLGIDGGGTHTAAAVGNEKGTILGIGNAGPSLYKVVGLKQAAANIKKAVDEAEQKAGVKPRPYANAVFGLSGVDSMKDWKLLSELVYKNFKSRVGDRFRVINDVVIVLAAGTRQPYGAALIAGTGSNAYAIGSKGEAYAGGLGHMLSDEGSAYWIGVKILQAAVKSFDGRGPETLLEKLLYERFKCRTMREVKDAVCQQKLDKTAIAALAPLCTYAARRGDLAAKQIFQSAAGELASMVTAVAARSGLQRRAFDVVLVGGVWKAGSIVVTPFTRALKRHAPRIRIIRLKKSPATGALRLAIGHDDTVK